MAFIAFTFLANNAVENPCCEKSLAIPAPYDPYLLTEDNKKARKAWVA
jgi:hypothetical protein